MIQKIPEKLINYSVFKDGTDFLGTADIELPNIEYMTETIKGSGIAGEIESQTIGHTSPLNLKMNWRTIDKDAVKLAAPKSHSLDFRGSVQQYNSATGTYSTIPIKVTVRANPKNLSLGKMDAGTTMGTSNDFSVSYIKIIVNGIELLEIDKYNYIHKINGKDYLADVKKQLGL